VGFSDTDKPDPANPCSFPIQRCVWWDYSVKPGDTVQYSAIPVVGPNQSKLSPDLHNASPVTPEMTIAGQCTPHLSAYFNKGIIYAALYGIGRSGIDSRAGGFREELQPDSGQRPPCATTAASFRDTR
jgi:hypothetical protein